MNNHIEESWLLTRREIEQHRIANIIADALDRPHIVRTAGVCGGSSRVLGTRVTVRQIRAHVRAWEGAGKTRGDAFADLVGNLPLTSAQIAEALRYAEEHAAEIDQDDKEEDVTP